MKSKILFAFVLIAIIISIYLTYDRAIVRQDFTVFDSSVEETQETPLN